MSSILPYIILALAAGACLPVQAGINAQLNLWANSSILSSAISFVVGAVALIGYCLAVQVSVPPLSAVFSHPWWIWTGGLVGAFFVAAIIVLAENLDAVTMVSLILAGQMIVSLLLDQFGLLGFSVRPITLWRVMGTGLIVIGIVIVRRF